MLTNGNEENFERFFSGHGSNTIIIIIIIIQRFVLIFFPFQILIVNITTATIKLLEEYPKFKSKYHPTLKSKLELVRVLKI